MSIAREMHLEVDARTPYRTNSHYLHQPAHLSACYVSLRSRQKSRDLALSVDNLLSPSIGKMRDTYLRRTQKSIPMTKRHGFGGGHDGEICEIHSRLTAAKNHDVFVNTKLFSLLECRRVDYGRDTLDAIHLSDIRNNMEASTYCHSIALPLCMST